MLKVGYVTSLRNSTSILPQSLRAASAYGTPKPLRVRALYLLRKLRVASLSIELYNFTRNTLIRLPK